MKIEIAKTLLCPFKIHNTLVDICVTVECMAWVTGMSERDICQSNKDKTTVSTLEAHWLYGICKLIDK